MSLWTLLFPLLNATETLPRCCFDTAAVPIIQKIQTTVQQAVVLGASRSRLWNRTTAAMRVHITLRHQGCLDPFNKVLVSRSAVTCDRVQTTHWRNILSMVSQYHFSAAEFGIFCAFRISWYIFQPRASDLFLGVGEDRQQKCLISQHGFKKQTKQNKTWIDCHLDF